MNKKVGEEEETDGERGGGYRKTRKEKMKQ